MWFLFLKSAVIENVDCTSLFAPLVQALRLCTGSRGIALAFHDHWTRRKWGVSVTTLPLFTPWKEPVPNLPQGRFGQVRNISPPPGFDLRNFQPVASRYTDYAAWPLFNIYLLLWLLICSLVTCFICKNSIRSYEKRFQCEKVPWYNKTGKNWCK
jgi:hypothetical protein